jgi:hypothetical protein
MLYLEEFPLAYAIAPTSMKNRETNYFISGTIANYYSTSHRS